MKIIALIVTFVIITLAVITAVETVNSPKVAEAKVETRADRRKKARG